MKTSKTSPGQRRNRWLVGETVTVDMHGTEVDVVIVRAPLADGERNAHWPLRRDAWIVDLDGTTLEVVNGKVL